MTPEQNAMIEALYLEMYEKLKCYGFSALGNDALAEEAVQETFKIACTKPQALCACPNPQGWLVLTLKKTIRNIRSKHETASRVLESYLIAQAKQVSFCEDGIRLNILYDDLADTEEFKLLSEFAIDGRSHYEMAKRRGISINACKKRVQRAKETLQTKIDK